MKQAAMRKPVSAEEHQKMIRSIAEQWRSRDSREVKQSDATLTDMPAFRRITGRTWQS